MPPFCTFLFIYLFIFYELLIKQKKKYKPIVVINYDYIHKVDCMRFNHALLGTWLWAFGTVGLRERLGEE